MTSGSSTQTSSQAPSYDWSNLSIANTLAARSHFHLYSSGRDAIESKSKLMPGTWKFHLAKRPLEGPLGFFETFDVPGRHDVKVPGMSNIPYPFPCNPLHIPVNDNECSRYVRLCFDGVDSAR